MLLPFPQLKETLTNKIFYETNAVTVVKEIINKFGKPTSNLGGNGISVPVWQLDKGKITFLVTTGVIYENDLGSWYLTQRHSLFRDVFTPNAQILIPDGKVTVGLGNLALENDNTYNFSPQSGAKKDSAQDLFIVKFPTGTYEIKFEQDYGYDTDITTLPNNQPIADIVFTSESGETMTVHISTGSDIITFSSDNLNCEIEHEAIQPPFDMDSMLNFL